MRFEVTLAAEVTPEQVIEEMSIEPADWAALDEETRWAVLRTKEATEAALRISLSKNTRPGDGFGGLAARIMSLADDRDCPFLPEPESLLRLKISDQSAYWRRRAQLSVAVDRFLHPVPVYAGVR